MLVCIQGREAIYIGTTGMTVWIYDHGEDLKVAEAAQAWFDENDPEGVAFEPK